MIRIVRPPRWMFAAPFVALGLSCSAGNTAFTAGGDSPPDETPEDTSTGGGGLDTPVAPDTGVPDTGGEPDASEQPFGAIPPGRGLVSAGGTMRSQGHRLEFTLGAAPAGNAAAVKDSAVGRGVGLGIQHTMGGTP